MSKKYFYLKGTFNGSEDPELNLGYLKNQEYYFRIAEYPEQNQIVIFPYQSAMLPPCRSCVYSQYKTFFDNWKHVTQITDLKLIEKLWPESETKPVF